MLFNAVNNTRYTYCYDVSTGNPVSTWSEVCKLGRAFPNLESLVLAECPLQSLMTPPPSPDFHLGILSYPRQGNGSCGKSNGLFWTKNKKIIKTRSKSPAYFVFSRRDDGLATRRVHTSQMSQPEPDPNQNVGRRGHFRTFPRVGLPPDSGLSYIRSE